MSDEMKIEYSYNKEKVREIVKRALDEDIGTGDITTENLIPDDSRSMAEIRMKESGVVAGIEVAEMVFSALDEEIEYEPLVKDGDKLEEGDPIARIEGKTKAILEGERVALNFLQRLSGIATNTREYVDRLKGYPARVVDTRKTTPGLRVLEKYAVRVGGGFNHRMGLYDAVLIKDNHITACGGITDAVENINEEVPHTVKIEVEVEGTDEAEDALAAGADIIMLDNMGAEEMKKTVETIGDKAIVEASGGITKENIAEVGETGVDVISVGALTHQIHSLDISLYIS